MKDVFWKVFAVITLICFMFLAITVSSRNRYVKQNEFHILDKWTGKIINIFDAKKRR